MSGDVKAAIAETAARAKQLLFKPDGKLKGPDEFASLCTMQWLLPSAAKGQELTGGSVRLVLVVSGCLSIDASQ